MPSSIFSSFHSKSFTALFVKGLLIHIEPITFLMYLNQFHKFNFTWVLSKSGARLNERFFMIVQAHMGVVHKEIYFFVRIFVENIESI